MTITQVNHSAPGCAAGAPARGRGALAVASAIGLSACGMQPYLAAPPDPVRVPLEIQAATLDTPAQSALLAGLGSPGRRFDGGWSAQQLALVAVDRSHTVAAARSEVDAARARQRLALQRQNPQVNLAVERHSEQEDGDSSLWGVGPNINLSLVPPAVRRLTGERAALDIDIARLAAIDIAWNARNAAVDAALAVLERQEEARHLQQATMLRDEAVAAARTLVATGVADAFEWQTMMLERNAARLAHLPRTASAAAARAELAAALTLPLAALEGVTLVADATLPLPAYAELQAEMLQTHPTVLRALAAHAQAERDLALAIAAQYPSLQLSPGYFFDQNDHVLSLLGGIVVPVFASHDAAIANAAAARDAASARVYAAQADVIVMLQRAHARWLSATTVLADARAIVADVRRAHEELVLKHAEGIGDALMVARAALQFEEAALQCAAAEAEERRAHAGVVAAARLATLDPPFARWLETLPPLSSSSAALPR